MDPGALVLILSVVLIVVLFSFLRGRGGDVRRRPEVVQYLLYDVRLNQALVETFHLREKPKRFEKTQWEINKSRIGFLSEELKETLTTTFALVGDLNSEIKLIKKDKSRTHKDMDVAQLGGLLAKCREGLEGWMMDTIGTTELPTRYPSLTGFLFGER